MRTSRSLFAAVAGLLALAVAGCSTGAPSGSGDAGKLRISSTSSGRAGVEQVVAMFRERNPGVNIRTEFADTDAYQTTLRTQLSSGTGPDIFNVWAGSGNPAAAGLLARSNYLEDLSGEPWAAQVPETTKQITDVDGKAFLAPLTADVTGAIYNEQMLAEVGLAAPQTWSEVLQLCDAATANGKVAFALGLQTPWVAQLVPYALIATTVYGADPDFDTRQRSGRATFTDPGWATALDRFQEMQQRGCFTPEALGTSYEAALADVADGSAVGVVQISGVLPQIQSQAPADARFVMHALPATDDPNQTQLPASGSVGYAVNAQAADKELALRFLEFLETPEAINAYANALGGVPVISNSEFRPAQALTPVMELMDAGRTSPYPDSLWPNAEVQQDLLAGVQEMYSGSKTPLEVLNEMQDAYQG